MITELIALFTIQAFGTNQLFRITNSCENKINSYGDTFVAHPLNLIIFENHINLEVDGDSIFSYYAIKEIHEGSKVCIEIVNQDNVDDIKLTHNGIISNINWVGNKMIAKFETESELIK